MPHHHNHARGRVVWPDNVDIFVVWCHRGQFPLTNVQKSWSTDLLTRINSPLKIKFPTIDKKNFSPFSSESTGTVWPFPGKPDAAQTASVCPWGTRPAGRHSAPAPWPYAGSRSSAGGLKNKSWKKNTESNFMNKSASSEESWLIDGDWAGLKFDTFTRVFFIFCLGKSAGAWPHLPHIARTTIIANIIYSRVRYRTARRSDHHPSRPLDKPQARGCNGGARWVMTWKHTCLKGSLPGSGWWWLIKLWRYGLAVPLGGDGDE